MSSFAVVIHGATPQSVEAAKRAGFAVYANESDIPLHQLYNAVIKQHKADYIGFIDGTVEVDSMILSHLERVFSSVEPLVGAVYCDEILNGVYNNLPAFSLTNLCDPYFFMNGHIKDPIFSEGVERPYLNALLKIGQSCPVLHIAEPLLKVE